LGNYTWQISSSKASSQTSFNLGIFHEFGFNQHEARGAMTRAVTQDPTCAMCFWGLSYSFGPFLNHPVMVDQDQLDTTYHAIRTAATLAVTNVEKDLIRATAFRYPDTDLKRNQTLAYLAYSNELSVLYTKYPQDPNIAVLYAESLMNLEANNYFLHETMGPDASTSVVPSGLRPYSKKANQVLTTMLSSPNRKFSRHPFALHLYIHLTEAGIPGLKDGAMVGEHAADILQRLNYTGSGHLEHMPGHLYLRVGRYSAAARANVLARVADEYYDMHALVPYGPCHNQYFGVYAACVAGMRSYAIEGSQHMRNVYAVNVTRGDAPGLEQGWNAMLTTYVRFGLWNQILNDTEVAPVNTALYSQVLRHYSRGFALLHVSGVSGVSGVSVVPVEIELAALQKIQRFIIQRAANDASGFNGMAVRLSSIANDTLSAAVLLSRGDVQRAIAVLSRAANTQDSAKYDEPPDWHYSTDACVGKVLLDHGLPEQAELAFQKDLKAYPKNGWGLTGLLQTMIVLNKPANEIEAIRKMLSKAWKDADIPIPSSSCLAFENIHV
jgi:tetratricopeptide (TPR) repeat protein